MRLDRASRLFFHGTTRGTAVALLTAILIATGSGTVAAAPMPSGQTSDPVVITDWNATAVAVIVTDAGKASAEAYLWYAFTHAAMYNAVVGITGRFAPYRWNITAPTGASPEAAAATAAYRVLVTYFPASKARLDSAFQASMDGIPGGLAKSRGIQFGERAAARIIRLRMDDGRTTPREFTVPPGPGVWRPTPTAFAPFSFPWLSRVRPLTLISPNQFRPPHPPFLTLSKYAREFNEVKDLGAKTDSSRDPDQTETALFFSDTAIVPFQAALRDLVARHGLDISESARLFAAVDMSAADALIGAWDGKFHFGYWRPITAIHKAATDGNADTEEDTEWDSFITAPPYPDYPSGLNAVVGSFARTLRRLLGTARIDLYITSTAAGVTRHYEFASQFRQDAVDSRVWSGIHFRSADVVGLRLGRNVANWALDHDFGP